LNNANLKGANLQRAYLRHVNLQNAVSNWFDYVEYSQSVWALLGDGVAIILKVWGA
jgi:uncharacterized protein YjbI with pentapeptide repeats